MSSKGHSKYLDCKAGLDELLLSSGGTDILRDVVNRWNRMCCTKQGHHARHVSSCSICEM